MIHRMICRLLFLLISTTTQCQGSKIVFTATPTNISEGVTPTLIVRCALEDEASSTSTVQEVTSIIIRRVEDSIQREVAKIVSKTPAVAGSWATGASVTGNLSNKVGYLQAKWSSPGQIQAGRYSCVIVALETDRTNIKFKSNVQVEGTSQTVGDLVKALSESKDEIEALKKAVSDLKTNGNPSDKQLISQSKDEIEALKKAVNDLKTNVANQSSTHSEQGLVVCEQSNNWGDSSKPRETAKYVRFSAAYTKLPVVAISPVSVDTDSSTKYSIKVRDLTTAGFTVVCSTWCDTLLDAVEVQWTSVVA